MEIVSRIQDMVAFSTECRRKGLRIGFVPTMGFLHEGHLSLVREARARCDKVVLSIFVNPTQFGPGEDLASYPRDWKRDEASCRAVGVDVVFIPSETGLYPPGYSVYVEETALSKGLCGASRPGHFRGVVTIVCKLFNIVAPDVGVFGQKDIQQARVIEKMVRDLNMPVLIVIAPTLREADGLAMSSRNTYLRPDERARASSLYRALQVAERAVEAGAREAAGIQASMRRELDAALPDAVEYVEIVDYDTMQPVRLVSRKAVAAVAVRFGRARLIDNVILQPPLVV
jgi:pantoate--beta-alanine ligase